MRWGISLKIMCDSVHKSFNYDALLLTCGFPEEACSLFLGCCVVVMRLWLCVFVLDWTVLFYNME
jgi:hypothetical protein